eukprot:CAMPEP_0196587120 /NCGR_PEP_ID=MMETSP1081-20130531/56515_1 /TAXON_ID=36882 /ORGANISM="Pyramimonas amylifera, Strain CCMP720" /LENGTH=214 /DNA_ID=CAMNT_0041909215 /DNA_START=50 /DNA_END=694 /DNA_ORIENTATION=-
MNQFEMREFEMPSYDEMHNGSEPMFKFVDPSSRILCTLTIGTPQHMEAAGWVQSKIKELPALRPLCVVLTRVLCAFYPNQSPLSGFLLANLVASFLQRTGASRVSWDFGDLLVGLSRYFGIDFDYSLTAVAAGRPQGVVPKTLLTSTSSSQPFISIEDPQQVGYDLGGHVPVDIQSVFAKIHAALRPYWSAPGCTALQLNMPPLLEILKRKYSL